ncbi:zinc finger BED domain-containing protein RICESLEEPER 2-like [Pistacia vera]|uniref:zinc finger BED domain-containing protein RICESLEEPER 2-like n=1 Tax=Pistacia vera TaxID=55513 RepID=UPI0012632EC1|nr:zinc finger BED domain-containing protein RICESLEEPER 2-like [Pistacia vera]
MEDILRNQLCVQNVLLCRGEFFHVQCSAHILNLIVQERLKATSVALNKIRDSVKYIKATEARRIKFGELVVQMGVKSSMGLRLDVSTRYNSTFLMLETALIYRHVFVALSIIDLSYKFCPSDDEWDRGLRICKFLEPFYDITTLFSGSKYPTANLYLKYVWEIQLRLIEKRTSNGIEKRMSEDEVVRSIAEQMMPKFAKYWDSYSLVLMIATILDSCPKFQFVEYAFKKVYDLTTVIRKLEVVKNNLQKLFQAYEAQYSKEVHVLPLVVSPASGPTLGKRIDNSSVSYYTF